MPYSVTHLESKETYTRDDILLNEHRNHREWKSKTDPAVEAFHALLPHYGETKLHSLPSIASELGFSHVFIKDESTRFGLPSFKILGASWAVHRTICQKIDLRNSTTLDELAKALQTRNDIRLVTCTEGNWGRAVSRMAKYLAIPATIYVPGFMNEYSRKLIRGEGADVRVLEGGSYDDTIAAVRHDAETTGALMVMDTSWEGYTEIPQWVTDGYSTMLRETDRQIVAKTGGKKANLAFVSVGVGSWAHAVVHHYQSTSKENKIVTVESEVAACFKESLHSGKLTGIETGETIMNGMNCGTPSMIAWPVLRDGIYAAVAVTDIDSHKCVQYLQSQDVNAGPCGAATLAALKKLRAEIELPNRQDSVVVLFSTEGMRDYEVPVENGPS